MMVSDVYRALWRHRMFVLLLTVLVVGATYVFTSRQTKLYTATSLVRVQQQVRTPEESYGALLTGERLARTYVRIAETDSVSDLVKAQLAGSVPSDAIVIEAAQLGNLELLGLSVTYKDPKVAAVIANTVPLALARFIEKTGSFRDSITVVERAAPPTTPSSPNLRLNLALAFLLGLILSAGLALVRDSLSDRIEDVEELERVAGHPVIAVIPNLKFQHLSLSPSRAAGEGHVEAATRGSTGRVKRVGAENRAAPASRWSIRD